MKELNFEGTVTTKQKINTQTEDIEKKEGVLVISTDNGEKIRIKGAVDILDGFGPKTDVTVKLKRAQHTLKESTK